MTQDNTNNPPRRRRKEARPQEILEAALKLFAEKGYSATKVDDIARAAGVTCGTPYLYFTNKEEIFKALIREYLLPRLQLGDSLLHEHQGPARDLFIALMKLWWDLLGSTTLSALPKIMVSEARNFPDVAAMYHEQFALRCNTLIRQVLEYGMARGEFRPLDLDITSHVLMAPYVQIMIAQHCGLPHCLQNHSPDEFLEKVADLLLGGLVAEGKK
jgi:AcrR family transcriptional regulator